MTGARFYAGLGIELRRLAVFARWRSDIVLHYVQDSALSRFTAECEDLLREDSPEQISSDDHMERVQIRSRIVKIEQAIEQAAVQEQRLTNRIEQLTALGCPKCVRNQTSGTSRSSFKACGLEHIVWLSLQSCSGSLHRLPCRPENNDVSSAGSPRMLGVPGLSCQASKQKYAGGLVSLYYRAVTEPHLAACEENIAGFHHLNLVGIGRVVLSPFVGMNRAQRCDGHKRRGLG